MFNADKLVKSHMHLLGVWPSVNIRIANVQFDSLHNIT